MKTIIRIWDLVTDFIRAYFWGKVKGACLTTGTAMMLKFADYLGNYDAYLHSTIPEDAIYNIALEKQVEKHKRPLT